jgi:phosphatidylglycerophosphate synthase
MLRAALADVLTGSRLVLGVVAAGALVGDRILLFSIVLSVAWATDVFDGRLARSSGQPTFFGDSDMLVDTWVGACVLVGFGLSDRAPLWLVVAGILLLGAIYLWTRNPAVSQVLQAFGYGGALWLIFTSEDATLAIPLGTLAVLMLLEYKKFFGKVLPMFFDGVVAFVKGERYEGPSSKSSTDDRTGA